VSPFGDDGSEMTPTWLDDDTIEAMVSGDDVDARFGQLTAFVHTVRSLGEGPAPRPSSRLEGVFAGSVAIAPARGGRRRTLPRGLSTAAAKLAALGLAAKIGLGTAVAAAGVAGAGAAGILPDQANDQVRRGIEAVSPVEFDHPGDDADGHRETGENFGDRVSSDATGESDGENGVDGQQISDEAPGAEHRPDDPGQNGQDQANETPAADHRQNDDSDRDDQGDGTTTTDNPSATAPSTVPPPAQTVPSTVPSRGRSGD